VVALKQNKGQRRAHPQHRSRNAVVALKPSQECQNVQDRVGSRNAVVALKHGHPVRSHRRRKEKQERRGGIETAPFQ